jgi:L-alanine-DL-glutamate epimerase-like enolase superfamily enzyme
MPATDLSIEQIEFWPVDVPLTDPFVVATGARVLAENVFIRITLSGGAHGYGEAAPFPEVGGENRPSCMNALSRLCGMILHRPVDRFSDIAEEMRVLAPNQPAARCALETAMIDAYCRVRTMPMWKLWGGSDVRKRETDITIPLCGLAKTVELADSWYQKGFRIFKMKIGRDVEEDVRRLRAVHEALPGISFIGDGNQGFSQKECLRFTRAVTQFGGRLILLEQPLDREDLDGLAAIRRDTGVPVAADESVRSLADAEQVVARASADYVNVKIMKTGVLEARAIAEYTRSKGLKLMIGGMVETRVAMGCSFSLVLGMTGFEILDLDTPLLLNQDPVQGGYSYAGSFLIPSDGPGLSVELHPQAETVVRIS